MLKSPDSLATWLACLALSFTLAACTTAPAVPANGAATKPSAPAQWNYVTTAAAALRSLGATPAFATFCGHTHMPQLHGLSAAGKLVSHTPVADVPIPLGAPRRWLAVIGSAGQPRDGNPAASFATYDTRRRELTYHRVPYDVETVAARVRSEGLPDVLAARLLAGR